MNLINRALRPLGWMLAPRPPSAKMLHEHANVTEVHHPSRGGRTVDWMRRVADLAEPEAAPAPAENEPRSQHPPEACTGACCDDIPVDKCGVCGTDLLDADTSELHWGLCPSCFAAHAPALAREQADPAEGGDRG